MSDVNAPVLVINSGHTPIHIKPMKEAISDVFAEVAQIVEHSHLEISDDSNVVSVAFMYHNWESWTNVSRPAIPFLRQKSLELAEQAGALRAQAKVLIDVTEAKQMLVEAEKLDKESLAVNPRVVKLSRGFEVRGPEVIRLMDYHEVPDMEIRLTRRNLLLRDNYTCQYCGKKVSPSNFTIDHVKPRSKGGAGSWENFAVACFPCNVKKRDRTPEEAQMKLLSKPGKPKWYPLTTRFAFKYPPSWIKFLPQAALLHRPPEIDVSGRLSERQKR